MADLTPPDQLQLDPKLFPNEPWAKALVEAFNKLSVQTTQALAKTQAKFRTLKFKTGLSVPDSFPIDVPVDFIVTDARVAQVVTGGTPAGAAISVRWTMLARGQNSTSGLTVRVSSITGLSANSTYEIRLALQ